MPLGLLLNGNTLGIINTPRPNRDACRRLKARTDSGLLLFPCLLLKAIDEGVFNGPVPLESFKQLRVNGRELFGSLVKLTAQRLDIVLDNMYRKYGIPSR